MADIKKIISDHRENIVAKIGEYNEALKANDLAKTAHIEQELKDAEAAYAEAKCTEVFAELAKEENPVKAAVAAHSYLVVSHRPLREDGVAKGFEIVEDKVRQIDLVKFCEFCKLPTSWKYAVEKFNQLLAMRTATELKMTKAQIKKICDSFYMNDLARKVEMGDIPGSNTAICKQLQQVVDGVLFEDNGKGKNVFRVNNHDVAYLLMCYTKRGKKTLTVAVAKNAYIHRLVLDVMHRIVTNKSYDLEYRMVSADKAKKNADAKEIKAEPEKVDAVETIVVEKSA